jgi:Bacterial Ig-like domain (group 2).
MKYEKKLFCVLIAACLLLSIVEFPAEADAKGAPDKITLKEGKSVHLKIGKSRKKIRRVTWKSKNRKIATVSKKGKVKAKSIGNTKITAKVTLKNGKKFTGIYKVCVRKKKSTPSPSLATLPKKPNVTKKPAVTPLPLAKPRIEAVSAEQGDMTGWEAVQAEAVICSSMYSEPDIVNQFVTSHVELMTLIKKLKAGTLSPETELLIKKLNAYDKVYFQDHVLCMVNVQVTCGYRPSITQLYQKDNGGEFPDIIMQYAKIKEIGDDQLVPCVMVNYIYGLEIARTALKGSNGTWMPGVTAAPPSDDRPIANPTSVPQPTPEIGTVTTAQGAVTDWKPIQAESVSYTEMMEDTGVKNQLCASYDELAALIEELKANPYMANEPIIAELEKYDEEYFQNYVLCLLDVYLTYGYAPSVKQIYSGDCGGRYAEIMMQYDKIKEYGDDQLVPDVMKHYIYRLEIAKMNVGKGIK